VKTLVVPEGGELSPEEELEEEEEAAEVAPAADDADASMPEGVAEPSE
jgi:hypothetical protein